jgi:hypothetical protein
VHLANEREHVAKDRSGMKRINEVANATFGERTYSLLAGRRMEPNSEMVCKRQTSAPLATKLLNMLINADVLVGQGDMNRE